MTAYPMRAICKPREIGFDCELVEDFKRMHPCYTNRVPEQEGGGRRRIHFL